MKGISPCYFKNVLKQDFSLSKKTVPNIKVEIKNFFNLSVSKKTFSISRLFPKMKALFFLILILFIGFWFIKKIMFTKKDKHKPKIDKSKIGQITKDVKKDLTLIAGGLKKINSCASCNAKTVCDELYYKKKYISDIVNNVLCFLEMNGYEYYLILSEDLELKSAGELYVLFYDMKTDLSYALTCMRGVDNCMYNDLCSPKGIMCYGCKVFYESLEKKINKLINSEN